MEDRRERGSVLPLVALMMALAGGAALLLGRVGGAAVSRAGARTAADAAALAGAVDGEEAARQVAAANGAEVLRYERLGMDARVTVRLGPAEAVGRARRASSSSAVGGDPGGLAPALLAAIARAEHLLGERVPITSGYRSPGAQAALYARRHENPYPVAPPGSSMHERGLAIDVPPSFVARLRSVGRAAGLCQPYPDADPIHFELCW